MILNKWLLIELKILAKPKSATLRMPSCINILAVFISLWTTLCSCIILLLKNFNIKKYLTKWINSYLNAFNNYIKNFTASYSEIQLYGYDFK